MIIKNYEELATTSDRENALKIIEAGFGKIDPLALIYDTVKFNPEFKSLIVHNKTFDVITGRIFVIGAGKAAGKMAAALEELLLPENIEAGFIAYHKNGHRPKKIKIINAGHPFPDRRSVKAAKKILKLKKKYGINEKDAVICLLSGGASSMLALPAEGISLGDKIKTTGLLLGSGAGIREINTVRKHISGIKGGRLAAHFHPAKVISLIISDVIGNKLDIIASGPTVPDTGTFMDAYSVLADHKLLEKIPSRVKRHILSGCEGRRNENPKTLDNVFNFVIGDNAAMLDAMAHEAKNLGYDPLIMSSGFTGRPDEAAEQIFKSAFSKNHTKKTAIICGGETYPKLPKKRGKGGRNLHLAALAMKFLKEKDFVLVSINTDGSDFKSEAAGAIIDISSGLGAEKFNFSEYINNYNTYPMFKKIGNSIIRTGRTGTNTADIILMLKKK
jgi:glycerate 2-kinase